jgi:cell division protein FtsZ
MGDAGSALMGIGRDGREPCGGSADRGLVSAPRGVDRRRDGPLLNITGGSDIGLFEVNEAAEVVTGPRIRTPTSSSAPS